MTSTLILLTHNHRNLVAKQLANAPAWLTHIFLVDNDSSEDIQSIGDNDRVRFFSHSLNNDFAAQRNWALSHVTTDWALFLDPDEEASLDFWREAFEAMNASRHDVLWFRRHDLFLGKLLKHGEVGATRLLRAVRVKGVASTWVRPVHETWQVNVPQRKHTTLTTPLIHHSHKSLPELFQSLHWYASLEPSARPQAPKWLILAQMVVYPIAKFLQNAVVRQAYRDGTPGIILAFAMSYYSFITRVCWYEALFTHRPKNW